MLTILFFIYKLYKNTLTINFYIFLINILFLKIFFERFFKGFSSLKNNVLLLAFPFVIKLILKLALKLILLILI